MRNILEDLYHGNLSVTERVFKSNTPFSKALARATDLEDRIRALLPEDKAELVEQFASAYADMMGAAGVEDFITGFRMGAQFLLAALGDEDGSFTPIAKL